MDGLTNVVIGIQARSNSTRLPKKAFATLGNKRLLDHVIDSCLKAAKYSNKFTFRKNYTTDVVLLIPEGDPIKRAFGSCIDIISGSEFDVLSRYVKAQEEYKASYICRITGDCPLIPPYIISKHISLAVVAGYDYISNVDESCRLSLDGIDCEVMSARMLQWLLENATTDEEKEHVTIKVRKDPPKWAKLGLTASFFDQSAIKLSVDTQEDLENVRAEYDRVGKKLLIAEGRFRRENLHRF